METHSPEVLATPETLAELDRLGDQIADLAAHLDAATARLLDLIREFDARGGWGNGFRSCAEWLSWRVGFEPGTAREHVRVARALGTLPRIRGALARGELSYAKVRAITRVAAPDTEERLLAVARTGTAAHVERIVRGWRRVDRLVEAREAARQHASRALHVFQDEDGMVVVRGRLTAEAGAVLMQALAAAREKLYPRPAAVVGAPAHLRGDAGVVPRVDATTAMAPAPDATCIADAMTGGTSVPAGEPMTEMPTMAQQQADALVLLAESALHGTRDPGAPGERYQVVVHVDAPVLADPEQPGQSVLDGGARVPAGTSARLACDATRVVMRHDADGRVVEVGARTRTVPPALRRALLHRDQGCRFPGCGRRWYTQAHHIRHWAAGGPTTLSNTTLLCKRHHVAVHEDGYQVTREPDGDLVFRRPDGRVLPDVPPRPRVPAEPVQALHAQHAVAGLTIGPRTGLPGWLGERLDVRWAIDGLHPRAIVPASTP